MGNTVIDKARLLEGLEAIDGWLSPLATDLTIRILQYQDATDITGAIVEIGVHRARYLALLHALAGHRSTVIGIDALLNSNAEPLPEPHRTNAMTLMRSNVKSISGSDTNLSLIGANTLTLSATDISDACGGQTIRYAHIDGGHDCRTVLHDLGIIVPNLAPDGVIALDDALSFMIPGVSEGFARYMLANEGELAPFAIGGNKLFVCRSGAYDMWSKFITDAVVAGGEAYLETAAKTMANDDKLGIDRSYFGYRIMPLR